MQENEVRWLEMNKRGQLCVCVREKGFKGSEKQRGRCKIDWYLSVCVCVYVCVCERERECV